MGVPSSVLTRLLMLHHAGLLAKGQKMLELGEQNLSSPGTGPTAKAFVEGIFGKDHGLGAMDFDRLMSGGLSGDLFELAGFKVTCIDIFPGKRTEIVDLNVTPPFPHFRGNFDIVTNFGTTEHILNQAHCFQYIHDCTKTGGIMIHQLPAQGWRDHCFFKYNPKFFLMLAVANSYSIIDFRINAGPVNSSDVSYWTTLQRNVLGPTSDIGGPDQNKGIFIALRKERDAPFAAPVDKTSAVLKESDLRELRFTQLGAKYPLPSLT